MPTTRSLAKRLVPRLAVTSATLALLLAGAEIATRWFGDIVPPLLVSDPVLGRRYVRSTEGDFYIGEAQREV